MNLAEGHYARKQLFCRDRLIAWSHRRRFEVGVALARPFAGRRVLDFGCGDGTLLALLLTGPTPPARAVGAEVSDALVADCRARLGHIPYLEFVRIEALEQPAHCHGYDAVLCMEVLEHVVDVRPVLDRLEGLLAAEGRLIISVPVETGLPLLVKQTARRIAGWRGLGDYPGQNPYTWRELGAALFAGPHPHMVRPVHHAADGSAFHDHKGFNWMALRKELARRFVLEKSFGSPLTWLPIPLASQAWFQLRRAL